MDLFFSAKLTPLEVYQIGVKANYDAIADALASRGFFASNTWFRESALESYQVHQTINGIDSKFWIDVEPVFKSPRDSIAAESWIGFIETLDREFSDIFDMYVDNPAGCSGPIPKGISIRSYAKVGKNFGYLYLRQQMTGIKIDPWEWLAMIEWERYMANLHIRPLTPDEWITYAKQTETVDIKTRVISGEHSIELPVALLYDRIKEENNRDILLEKIAPKTREVFHL